MVDDTQLQQFITAGSIDVSVLLLQKYRLLGMTVDELVVFLEVKAMLDRGYQEPSTEKIADYMGMKPTEVFGRLESMRAKGLVIFETHRDDDKKLTTTLNFQALYQKLIQLPRPDTQRTVDRIAQPVQAPTMTGQNVVGDEPSRADIFTMLEQEFGRQLSPLELETVSNWFDVDHFLPVLMRAAIKEAVANQALNLRYIESILVNWTRLNYRSEEDVIMNSKRRKQYQKQNNQNQLPKQQVPLNVDLLHLGQ
ncbi:DnaD domain-containing protein [Weissella kandleri]|uniref:DnaD domain-containing protein n=1 Tax=Weissella kandleri TaxID=1616 RepID=UPI00387E718F